MGLSCLSQNLAAHAVDGVAALHRDEPVSPPVVNLHPRLVWA